MLYADLEPDRQWDKLVEKVRSIHVLTVISSTWMLSATCWFEGGRQTMAYYIHIGDLNWWLYYPPGRDYWTIFTCGCIQNIPGNSWVGR
jgi:hypothetical protein